MSCLLNSLEPLWDIVLYSVFSSSASSNHILPIVHDLTFQWHIVKIPFHHIPKYRKGRWLDCFSKQSKISTFYSCSMLIVPGIVSECGVCTKMGAFCQHFGTLAVSDLVFQANYYSSKTIRSLRSLRISSYASKRSSLRGIGCGSMTLIFMI